MRETHHKNLSWDVRALEVLSCFWFDLPYTSREPFHCRFPSWKTLLRTPFSNCSLYFDQLCRTTLRTNVARCLKFFIRKCSITAKKVFFVTRNAVCICNNVKTFFSSYLYFWKIRLPNMTSHFRFVRRQTRPHCIHAMHYSK